MNENKYESVYVDVTNATNSHSRYFVRDTDGQFFFARGDRIQSDKMSAIQGKSSLRFEIEMRYVQRANKLVEKIPKIMFLRRRAISKRIKKTADIFNLAYDYDAWWFRTWHLYKNDVVDLPYMGDIADSLNA